ncbi:hypothetical protein INR49_026409 [Caranx melampygus]|nr:hypothetical protein INR49_026409 [Caranx melampygus]
MTRNKYVYLQAQFGNEVLDKVVLVSFQSGYIFIQTDKTLYTPDSRGYYDGAYQLSKLASSGVYKVVAKFLSNPQYVYSAEFEVKEYVLPNFEVKLKSPEAYFRVDREALIINIEANYLFNEKVEGTATVVFGIMHDGQKKPFPNSVKMVDISEGVGEVKLTKADIRPLIITNLIGGSIFVHASVQTEDGAEMVHAELRNIKIVSSPYAIYFRRTPKYFKPGMDFDVVIETLRPDGSPAKQVQVVLEPGMVTGTTEENGMARLSINTNPTLKELVIKATTTNHEGPKATSTMTVLSYNSPSESYIHIGIGKAEVKVGENLKVNFNYNKRDVVDDITYLVLSKGQLVKYGRYKVTTEVVVSRPIDITKDMIPSFRIIAYYHTPSNEVVADSVWVDVQDTCMGSLNLEIGNPDEQIQPKDNIYLKITGDPGATVALVAVDKGVFLLNNKLRLTQQKIWDEMEKQDTGCTPGGGRNNMGVFYDAGLVFSSTASPGTPSRQGDASFLSLNLHV